MWILARWTIRCVVVAAVVAVARVMPTLTTVQVHEAHLNYDGF